MSDLCLFDIGWFFFAAWSVMVAVVTVTAFAPELFPSKTRKGTTSTRAEYHPQPDNWL